MFAAVLTAALAIAAPAPPVILARFDAPTEVTSTASQPGRLYVVEQDGVIRVFEKGRVRSEPFLDIRSLVSSGGERGLLSLAFHRRYATNRLFYVDYTDTNGDTRVVEYRSDGVSAIPSSARQLFFERQPYPNHNGGQLAFGPDGLLYIGLGDGGSGGDPNNYAQTFGTKLGKIWKLDVDKEDAQPVMAAYGLRNPWRFSFDRLTGDLYVGDVGQSQVEEIDWVPKATLGRLMNFGWSVYEGRAPFDSSRQLDSSGRLVWPVRTYTHSAGCSVTGGYVYRGKSRRDLIGRYFYGDYCSGTVWSLRMTKGRMPGFLRMTGWRKESFRIPGLSSFGEGPAGGLYAVSSQGALYRIAS